MKNHPGISGIINVYKETCYTSHDVVAKLRGILRQRKIGHTGTLDPDATGVLPVCLGKATKICSLIEDWEKSYQAVMYLGVVTDTEDMSGTVLRQSAVDISPEQVIDAINSFQGDYSQIPPMYSAKKRQGRKLYELAREGIVVEREPCPVHIHEIKVEEVDLPRVRFSVTCSKGTYIRSLCRDIGEKLGCGACMESLQRNRVGRFAVDEAVTLHEIELCRDQERLEELILPVDRIFADDPAVTVSKEGEKLLYNGNPIPFSFCTDLDKIPVKNKEKRYRVYDSHQHFIGIYVSGPGQTLKPVRLFYL